MHGGCLTSTVRTKKAKYLATADTETDVVNGTECTESLDKMRHIYDILLLPHIPTVMALYYRRSENTGKAVKDDLRGINTQQSSFFQKCYPLTLPHLVKIWRGGNDGYATLLEHGKHFPEFLTTYGIHPCGRFVKEQDTGLMHQCARQCQFLFHAA